MVLSANPFLNTKRIEKGVWFSIPTPPVFKLAMRSAAANSAKARQYGQLLQDQDRH